MKNSILRDYKQSTEYYQIDCFNFDEFILPDHKKEISHSFLEWFVGFSEVKAEFQIRGFESQTPAFEILDNDIQLLHKIRTTLGFGKITVYNQQCWKYSVRKHKWVNQLIHLFNGNFVLKNTLNKFNRWVNKQKKIPNFFFKQQCVKFSLRNAWFSGFIQAKAKFNASFSINTYKKISNSVYFSISGNQTLCHEIEKLFMVTATFYHYQPKQYKIIFINLSAQKQLIDYLFNFPVFGQQYKTFYCWWRVYLYRQGQIKDPAVFLGKNKQQPYIFPLKQQKN